MSLSPQLDKVHAFIVAEIAAKRRFPTAIEIAQHMGWKNAQSANDALLSLADKGRVEIASRVPSGRGWRYTYKLREDAA